MNADRHGTTPPAEATSLFKNSAFLAIGKITVLFTFLLYIFAARRLGDTSFGDFMLSLAIASVLFTLPNWGTNRYSSIVAARRPSETSRLLAENLGLTACLSLVYLPLAAVAAYLIRGESVVVLTTIVLALELLVMNFSHLLRVLLRVFNLYHIDMLTSSAERIALTGAAVGGLLLFPTPVGFAAGMLAGRLLGALGTAWAFRRRVASIGIDFSFPSLKELFRAGAPIAIRNALASANLRVDLLVLGAMAPSAQVGWYGAVYKLVDGTMLLPNVVQGSLGPPLSANYGGGKRDVVERLYRRGYKYLLIIGLFPALLYLIYADFLVSTIFGVEYAPGAVALQILSAALLFMFVRNLGVEVMDNTDMRAATARIFFITLIANAALNLLLVPLFGYIGAAAATVAAEAFLAVGLVWTLRRAGYAAEASRQSITPLIAVALTAAVLLLLPIHPLIGMPLGGLVYLAALSLLGTWDAKDLLVLRSVTDEVKKRLGGSETTRAR